MKVVVDASNVAYHVKNENGEPKLANILAAVKALEESEDEFVIIADASLFGSPIIRTIIIPNTKYKIFFLISQVKK